MIHAGISRPTFDDSFLGFLSKCEQDLGVSFNDRNKMFYLERNSRPIFFVLMKMGFIPKIHNGSSRETHAVSGYSLPKYLTELIENYDELSPYELRHGRKYICDYVNNMVNTKMSLGKDRCVFVCLHTQPLRNLVLGEARTFISAHNSLYPDSKLSLKKDFIPHTQKYNGKTVYNGIVKIPLDCVLNYPRSASRPLGAKIIKKARYSYEM
jgi:hypothetical protein